MCGIAGIVRLSSRPLPTDDIASTFVAALSHRGPDGTGVYCSSDVILVHTRLAILDLKHGSQPMRGCSSNFVSAMNGEIYNYQTLRTQLLGNGHKVHSSSDAEVVPHLFEEHGAEAISLMDGIFALAVWDAVERRLILARDRMGVKPLYYTKTEDLLIFGSEIKAIFATGLVTPEIDMDSVDDLFSITYPFPPRTMFRGVYELRPAHLMTVTAEVADVHIHRYWQMPFEPSEQNRSRSQADLIDEFRARLQGAVEHQLAADVPVGLYVSGGIDSAAVSAFATAAKSPPRAAFSVSYSEPRYDETSYAQLVTKHLGLHHTTVHCDTQTAAQFADMIWHMELPLCTPYGLSLLDLSKAVKAGGCKVILGGDGADEILAGYDCFRADKIRRISSTSVFRPLSKLLYPMLYRWTGASKGVSEHLLACHFQHSKGVTKNYHGFYPPWYDTWSALDLFRDELLGRDGRRVRPVSEPPQGYGALLRPDYLELHPLDQALAFECETRLPGWALLIADRASMANGVEVRVPFLDTDLVEFVSTLPPDLKLSRLTEKSILRKAMRGMLPKEIRNRTKVPFRAPVEEWFFSDRVPDFVSELLDEQDIERRGIFDPSAVRKIWDILRTTQKSDLLHMRAEALLVLILGTQMLHYLFVERRDFTRHTRELAEARSIGLM